MIAALSQYLDVVRDNLRLNLLSEREVLNELETHIEDQLEEMKEAGLSDEEAAENCIARLGPAKLVARRIYEAHSQGTWQHVLLASMPHLLFASLFALNWWNTTTWLIITLSLIFSMVVLGLRCGRPVWLFPWLGYSLLPIVVAGLLLLYLPRGWSRLAILVYVPLALWLIYSIAVQSIKRDWLYSALMLLPIPIIIGWVLAVGQEGKFLEFSRERIQHFAPWIGLSFLALAVTAAVFIRLRQRWLRLTLLIISGLLTLIMVAFYAEGRLDLPAFAVLILIMLALLLSPVLIERRIRYGK